MFIGAKIFQNKSTANEPFKGVLSVNKTSANSSINIFVYCWNSYAL